MFQTSIAANDYQVKSCIMVATCQPITKGVLAENTYKQSIDNI